MPEYSRINLLEDEGRSIRENLPQLVNFERGLSASAIAVASLVRRGAQAPDAKPKWR